MRLDITLRGEKAERFREIQDALEEDLGYRPDRPEVVMLLASDYDQDRETVIGRR